MSRIPSPQECDRVIGAGLPALYRVKMAVGTAEPAWAAWARQLRFPVAGAELRAGRGPVLSRGHPGVRGVPLHTRYRRDLIEERSREKHLEKLLEWAGIKLSGVLADLLGVSGRDIMAHLIAGERDPWVLARLARRRARAKIPGWSRRWRAPSSSPATMPHCWRPCCRCVRR